MYFNRKNAEQKNWRMIKKGKHFLFGCSLVFAVGAALVAPSVKADTVGAKPVAAKENVTYVAPDVEVASAAVAEEKVEKTVETTQNSKEEAVEATEKAKEAVEATEKAKEAVEATEKAKKADSIQAPEVTVVYNPAALTDEEKAKVVAAVKAANPTATDVQVQADGSAVVTFADGSRANLTAAQTIKDGSQVAKPRRARATVAAPVITSNLDGKGSSATDVTVQAPAGSTVKLYNTDGVVIGQAVANAQGVATVTPTNSLPVGEITATATPAGESESPKSAPVTATRPTLTTVEGGVSRGNDSDNTQLLVTKSHITVYPGESVKVGVTAISKKLENFSVPNNPAGVKGLLPRGTFLKSGGTGEPVTRRDNGYGGTVAWDQPAGDTVVTFSASSKNNVPVTRDLRVTVLELTKKLDAVPGEKVEVADLNNVSEDEKNKIIAATKKANASFPPGTVYNVDQRGNLVITYPDKSTDKIDASYLVTPSNKPADPNKPVGQVPEITSDLSGKASTPTDVTVKAEPGSTVKLYNNDGVVIGEAVANDQGIATISPINSLPEGQITATATPAGGSESPKSTPITATRAEKPEVGGGVSRGGDNTQLLVTKSHITVYPGETVNIGVTAVSNELAKFWVPGNPVGVKGLKPTGAYLAKPGSPAVTRRDNGYGGTVAWDQPAGDTVVTFEAQSREHNVIVRRDLRVTVLELTKKLDAVAGEKVEVADPNNVSEDEKNKIIEATKKANASFPPGTTYSVDEKGNLVITYPDKSTDKIAAAYLVTPAPKEADQYTPTAKAQTVAPGSTPEAKNSIGNVSDLPSGTTFAYKTPVDTATKGEKDAIVVVTYPDGSKDEVPVKVTVKDPRSDADKNDPKAKAQDIYKGSTPDAKGSIDNADELPYGTSFAYKTPVDTTTPGKKDATVVVTYPDGSKDEVPVKVTVEDPDKISDAEKNTPTAKDQTVKVGEKPKAEASIGNFDKLPKGTTVEFKKPVDTTTPGEKDAIVVVTYPDTLTYEVPVKVTVKDPRSDADKNDPKAKAQTVTPGTTPKAEDSIGNVSDLPSGTTFAFKTPVDTATEGEKDATVVVTYPDGTTDEVPVKVTVKDPRTDADKNDPKAKAQTVTPGTTPKAEDSIGNVSDLPSGTTFAFKTPVDTATEGEKDATVVVTYPDGTKDEVPVKVTVKDPRSDADKNDPTAKAQTVAPGSTPKAEDSIGNVSDLPSGTTFAFKTPVDTATEGEKDATVVVTYPDGTKDEVPVKVTVKDPRSDADKNDPKAKAQTVTPGTTPKAEDSIGNVSDLPSGTTFAFKTPVDTATEGEKDATVVVTYPDGTKDEVPVKVTVKDPSSDADKYTPVAKAQTVAPGSTPKAEDSIGNVSDLPSGTTFAFKTPVDTATEGEKDATVVVTYPDGTKDEVPVKVTVKDPRTDADKNDPKAKAQTVTPGTTPKAEDSIGNVSDLPSGTTFAFKTPVDTATEGEKDATVVVTYPDGTKDEVPVKVTVKDPRTDADKNDPKAKAQTVAPGSTPKAEDSIGNVSDLPSGTTFAFKTPVDTATEGEKDATVVVTYPDGTKDEVPVKVTVKDPSSDADKYTPVAKAQTVAPGSTPKAEDSIGNVSDLPSGTTFAFKTPVDTATEGEKDATVVVTYPDGTKDEVPVKVTVKDPRTDADKNDPKAKAQTVTPGTTPKAEDSIGNVSDLPSGTTFAFKTPVDTATEGEKDATVVVTYPDGTKDEVPVKVTVKDPSSDADKYTPVAKAQTVAPGSTPKAEDSIGNVSDLPSGTTFAFKTPVDTATEGEKDATVVVTYPDGSKDEVPVKVTVKTPTTPTQPVITTDLTGKAGTKTPVEVTAEPGSKVEMYDKDGNKIGEATTGVDGKATITPTVDIPEGNVTVVASKDGQTPEASDPVQATKASDKELKTPAVTPVVNPSALTDAEKAKVADEVKKANPTASKVEVGNDGTATVTFPDGSVAVLTPDKTVKEADSNGVKTPALTPVVNPSALTDAEKAKVADEVKKANPTASKVEVGNDGTATVTFPDGSVAVLTPDKTVKEADSNGVKTPAVTPVVNPSALTDAEKAKVADEVKKANPTASKVEVGNDGTATVTFPDGSVAVLTPDKTVKEADSNGVKTPALTPVVNPSALTDAEKAKVADEVKKANPTASKVEVGNDGTATVTFPDGSVAVLTPDKTVKEADSNGVKTPAVTPVVNPSALTDAEKAKVADEVKKANPTASKVEVGNDGTATVTFPDGSVAVLTPDKTVKEADSNGVKTPALTPVVNPSALTDAEKAKVADEVKKANPTASKVEVGNDGTATVTFPDGSVAVLTPAKTVKEADSNGVKTPAVTPVVNPSALTDAEKAKVADEVKKANPTASKVEVGNDGTATVTFPDGSVAVLTPAKTVKEADSNGVKTPALTPVVNPSALTDAEKAKVADEVKKANPTASKVEVGNDGTATVTFPDGSVAVLTPDKTVKEADSNGVKTPAVTPVVNPSALTDAEKAKVADEVKKANPTASKVEVGNDGTATVTFPDGSVAVLTPAKTVKEADSNGVKTPALTPVVNPSALTDAEKAKVADEVKKANPTASKVEVGNDGTATVTFPDGSVAVLTPDKTVKEADSNGVKTPAVTPVVNPSALTDAEKAKVADEVKKANPTASKVEVGNDGTATVTFPDGSVAVLTPDKTVKEADSNGVKTPALTPVVNPSALTDAEKAKVADEVKKANPTASKVEVGNDGTATVTFPDGSVAVLTPAKTVKEADSNGVKTPAVTPVVNPSALTDAEKAKVADEVKKANPTASKVEVGNDGTATVTFPDGSVAVLTPDKTVKEADSNGVKTPAVTPVVNPSALTNAEKAKVADEVKKANPTASKVEVGNDGTATVTFPDGSVAVLTPAKTVKEADSNGVKTPALTPVVNPSALTNAEKAKVADEVKKANPTASKVEVGNDGTATVTFPDGSVAVLTPAKTVKEADSNGVKTPALTPVVNPSALTNAEKAKVADEVKKANPTASKVEVGNDGTATVTFPDGSVAVLTPAKTVKEADSNGVKTPALTPVVNPSALTDAEKAKVADEVKKANPTASKVEVGNDGTATVTFPDGSVAVLTPAKTVKEADSNGVKTPAVTPVVNPSALTDAEKAKVADEVKKANPTASKVEVGNDGTATVTFPDGSVAVLTPAKTVKEADSNGVKTPALTPVVNPSALTNAEKAKVADEVKKANPTASKVEVGNDGTATVTFPDGSVAVIASENTVKKATKESATNQSAKKAGAKELPNTGTEQSNASLGLALLAAATGGLLFAKKRKEEE